MSDIFEGLQRGEQYSTLHRIMDLNSVNIVGALRSLNTLRTHADICLALSQMILMCGDHEISGVTCIPRSFTSDFDLITWPVCVTYSKY